MFAAMAWQVLYLLAGRPLPAEALDLYWRAMHEPAGNLDTQLLDRIELLLQQPVLQHRLHIMDITLSSPLPSSSKPKSVDWDRDDIKLVPPWHALSARNIIRKRSRVISSLFWHISRYLALKCLGRWHLFVGAPREFYGGSAPAVRTRASRGARCSLLLPRMSARSAYPPSSHDGRASLPASASASASCNNGLRGLFNASKHCLNAPFEVPFLHNTVARIGGHFRSSIQQPCNVDSDTDTLHGLLRSL